MASIRTICERAIETVQEAMAASVAEPRTVLALAKELRALLRQLRDLVDVPADPAVSERMRALAAKRHAKGMRQPCENDAATHAGTMRQPCGDPCENHAETDAAAASVPSSSGTTQETLVRTEQKEETEVVAVPVQSNLALVPAADVREACESDAKPRAKRDAVPQRPDDVPQQTWDDWCAHRRKKRAVVNATVLVTLRTEAASADMTLAEAMALTVANGWQGFRADWVTANSRASPDGGYDRFGKWHGVPKNLKPSDYTPAPGTVDEWGFPIKP